MQWLNQQYISISSNINLAPNRWQTIIWKIWWFVLLMQLRSSLAGCVKVWLTFSFCSCRAFYCALLECVSYNKYKIKCIIIRTWPSIDIKPTLLGSIVAKYIELMHYLFFLFREVRNSRLGTELPDTQTTLRRQWLQQHRHLSNINSNLVL